MSISRRRASALVGSAVLAAPAALAAKDLPRAKGASVGLSQAGLDALKAEMTELVTGGRRAGIVYGVVKNGKLVALETIGLRNVERNLPMTADTAFRLYSQSRAVTAAAILSLIDDGKLTLDDPVARYIPEIGRMPVLKDLSAPELGTEPQKTPMTVRHLFTYTSGLGYAADWPKSFGMKQREILDNAGTIADAVRKLSAYPLLTQPGAKWRYGFSSDVLGRVAEIAAGQPLDHFLKARLFDRIGMTGTGFWVTGPADRLAEVYGPDDSGKLVSVSAKAPPSGPYTKPGTLFSAGGGLVSTVPDYLRFCQMLLNGGALDGARVLKAETVKTMLTRQTTPAQGLVYWYDPKASPTFKGYAWGLAIGVRADEAEHAVPGSPGDAAWGGLANTAFFVDPREKLAAVAMAQYLGPDEPALAMALRRGVYGALRGKAG
jgi:CubicO group peptidase (beta-lactamase class C family)